jgi:hypothetical protein
MNASTTKALSLGIVVALWAVISHFGKLPLQLWPVLVGLACFIGAGGGMMGLQKSILGSASGVVWALLYVAVSRALGGNDLLDALVMGAAVFGMVFQARVPLLCHGGRVPRCGYGRRRPRHSHGQHQRSCPRGDRVGDRLRARDRSRAHRRSVGADAGGAVDVGTLG